eukprot:554724-Prymnesium_polylepis.1
MERTAAGCRTGQACEPARPVAPRPPSAFRSPRTPSRLFFSSLHALSPVRIGPQGARAATGRRRHRLAERPHATGAAGGGGRVL